MSTPKVRYFKSGKFKLKLPPLPKKRKPNPKADLALMVKNIDLPHLRNNGVWRTKSALGVTQVYAEQLRKLKMREESITVLVADLYWAAYEEFLQIPDKELKPKA